MCLATRREGKQIYSRTHDDKAMAVIETLYEQFCADASALMSRFDGGCPMPYSANYRPAVTAFFDEATSTDVRSAGASIDFICAEGLTVE